MDIIKLNFNYMNICINTIAIQFIVYTGMDQTTASLAGSLVLYNYKCQYLVLQDQQHGVIECTRRRLMCAELPKPHPWSPLLPPIQLAAPSTTLTGAIRRPTLVEAPPGWSISHGSPFPCLNPIWKFPTERERKSTTAAATQGTINTWMESRLKIKRKTSKGSYHTRRSMQNS